MTRLGESRERQRRASPDEEHCRRMRITGFPVFIVYREEQTEIVVYAVRPDARAPGYWLSRT